MSARVSEVRRAGPFTEGEIPLPFTVKYDQSDIDFSSGFTLDATLEDEDGAELTFGGTVDWETSTIGLVKVELAASDCTRQDSTARKETRRLQIWTGDGGTNRVATVLIKYGVDAPVGTPPAV